MSRAQMPVATQAFSSRAPSMWVARPLALAISHDLVERGLLPDRAAADIGGLLDADDGLRRLVARARMQRCLRNVSGVNCPSAPWQRRDLEAAERGMRAAFAGDDVRGLVREDLVAGPAMHQRRGDVAHRARRHEDRGLLAEQLGDALAQRIDGRIVADLLVADLGPRHRLAHRQASAGLRVRQQIDADRRRLGIARGRGVVHGSFSRSLIPVWCRRPDPGCCNRTSVEISEGIARLR